MRPLRSMSMSISMSSNYGNEDNANARHRIGRIIRAMRMDMGGQDADGDGMPDEWERFKAGSTALKANGDTDGDGISDFDEWWTDSHPLWVCPVKEGHHYQIRSRLSPQHSMTSRPANSAAASSQTTSLREIRATSAAGISTVDRAAVSVTLRVASAAWPPCLMVAMARFGCPPAWNGIFPSPVG